MAKERILEINPNAVVNTYQTFYTPQTESEFDFSQYDYVIDAIDTVVGKLSLIEKAKAAGTPIICAMGAGNKLDPTRFEVADISKTSVCPLARVIRTELRKRKITGVKVVYSKEPPITPKEDMSISCKVHCVCPPGTRKCTVKHQIPGSTAFVPPVVGLTFTDSNTLNQGVVEVESIILQGEVIDDFATPYRISLVQVFFIIYIIGVVFMFLSNIVSLFHIYNLISKVDYIKEEDGIKIVVVDSKVSPFSINISLSFTKFSIFEEISTSTILLE